MTNQESVTFPEGSKPYRVIQQDSGIRSLFSTGGVLKPIEKRVYPVGTVFAASHGYGCPGADYAVVISENLIGIDQQCLDFYEGNTNQDLLRVVYHHLQEESERFGVGYYRLEGELKDQAWINNAVNIAAANKARETAKQEEKHNARNEVLRLGLIEAERLIPKTCPAVIVAYYEVDDSDLQTDYFGSHTDRESVCVLSLSTHTKNNFAEFRKAAALSDEPGINGLAEENPDNEHRENYSGGHGYYLSNSYHKGWTISKYTRRTDGSFDSDVIYALGKGQHTLSKKASPSTKDEIKTGWRLNQEKEGVEIKFDAKPAPDVIEKLKSAGFRWSRFQGLWWAKQTPYRVTLAQTLANAVEG